MARNRGVEEFNVMREEKNLFKRRDKKWGVLNWTGVLTFWKILL
jgi:hypothetical protein